MKTITKILWIMLAFVITTIVWPIIKEVLRLSAILMLQFLKIALIAVKDMLLFAFNLLIIGTLTRTIKALS